MMFQEWCRRFDKNEYRNHFVKGGTSIKAAQRCISICIILVSLSFRKKKFDCGNQGATTGDLLFTLNFTH